MIVDILIIGSAIVLTLALITFMLVNSVSSEYEFNIHLLEKELHEKPSNEITNHKFTCLDQNEIIDKYGYSYSLKVNYSLKFNRAYSNNEIYKKLWNSYQKLKTVKKIAIYLGVFFLPILLLVTLVKSALLQQW